MELAPTHLALVPRRTALSVALALLLSGLLHTVDGNCVANSDKTAPGEYYWGCPNGYDCRNGKVSDTNGASCYQCEAGKWRAWFDTGGNTNQVTNCNLCEAGRYR